MSSTTIRMVESRAGSRQMGQRGGGRVFRWRSRDNISAIGAGSETLLHGRQGCGEILPFRIGRLEKMEGQAGRGLCPDSRKTPKKVDEILKGVGKEGRSRSGGTVHQNPGSPKEARGFPGPIPVAFSRAFAVSSRTFSEALFIAEMIWEGIRDLSCS